jgi:hypothetical protein
MSAISNASIGCVMPGLVPGINASVFLIQDVDDRVKPGDDDVETP